MKQRLRSTLLGLLLAGLSVCAVAQGSNGQILYAADFGKWSLPQGTSPTNGMIQWQATQCTVPSLGFVFVAPKVGRPLFIRDSNPALSETVIPSSVIINNSSCTVAATMAHTHYTYQVYSGTGGLQEAIDYELSASAGALVALTTDWTVNGGTTGMLSSATGNTGVSLIDERTSCFKAYNWGGSSYTETANFCTGGGGSGCTTAGLAGTLQGSDGAGGCEALPADYGLSTTNGFSFGVSSPLVATAASCDGTTCTVTAPNSFTDDQNIRIGSVFSPACAENTFTSTEGTTTSSSFEFSEADSSCTGTVSGTGGYVVNYDESVSRPFYVYTGFNADTYFEGRNFTMGQSGDITLSAGPATGSPSSANFITIGAQGNITIASGLHLVTGSLTGTEIDDDGAGSFGIQLNSANYLGPGGPIELSNHTGGQSFDTQGGFSWEDVGSVGWSMDTNGTGNFSADTIAISTTTPAKFTANGSEICTLATGCGSIAGVTSINTVAGAFTFSFSSGAGSCSGTTCTFTGSSSGGGSVTNFIAGSGSWPTWLVPSVSSSTTTPTLSVSASAIPYSALTALSANQVLGATTGTTPSGLSMPSCSASSSALTYATGSGFGCNTINGIPYPSGTGIPNVTSGTSWGTTYNALNLIPANFISTLNQNTTGNAATASAFQSAPTGCSAGNALVQITPAGNPVPSTGCAPIGGSPLWSSLLSPTSNNSLSMASYTTVLTYGSSTGSSDLFKLTDLSSNTGTGILLHVATASGSTETPWQADANGIGCKITSAGALQCFGGTHFVQIGANSGGLPSPTASTGTFSTDPSGNVSLSQAGGTFYPSTQTIASGQTAIPVTALAGNTCDASATTATATGAATTDSATTAYASDPTGVTGYGGGTNGGITVRAWVTSNTYNFKRCNETDSSITPGALSVNWRVTR